MSFYHSIINLIGLTKFWGKLKDGEKSISDDHAYLEWELSPEEEY